jgi:hypothetical protein
MNQQPCRISDKDIEILLNNHPDGRYELKDIAKILKEPEKRIYTQFNSAKRKLKRNPKKWKKFKQLIVKYWEVKKRNREK